MRMHSYLALLFVSTLLFNNSAPGQAIPEFRVASDSVDDDGYRHLEIKSESTTIRVTLSNAGGTKGRHIILMVPGKTETGSNIVSLSEGSIRVMEGMCQGENTCVVDWDKGSVPFYEQGQTTRDYADSIVKVLEFLQSKRMLTISKLGIIAHSEGALAAMMLANRVKPRPCFVVLLAPPGIRGDELTMAQNDDGYDVSRNIPSKLNDSLLEDQFNRLRQEPDENKVETIFENKLIQSYGSSVDHSLIHDTAVRLSSPWMKAFIDIDPSRLISSVGCSWVAIWGSDDTIIRPNRNSAAYKIASKSNGHGLGEVMLIDGYDHFFRRTEPPDSAMDMGINDMIHFWYDVKWHN
jgi:pimeloyl-ACP methyl ester carboxylesterase